MVTKKPTRNMDFTAQDEGFIRQLCGDIGCYYRKASETTYSLNRHDSDTHGEMGVFGWVHKEDDDYFWVATRRAWIDEAMTRAMAGGSTSPVLTRFPGDNHDGDSVSLDAKDGYRKTVSLLKLIKAAG